jgi:simple sugar transport system substrate-binding protein
MLGQGSIRKFNLKKGDEAIVFGISYLRQTGRGLRSKGCLDALKQKGIITRLIPLGDVLENRPSSPEGIEKVAKSLLLYPGTDLIVTDHGDTTSAIATILKKIGKSPNDYYVSGFDLSQKTVQAIKEGYVDLVHDQQPYLQGYLSVLQVCLAKKYSFSGLYIDTGVGLIDNFNIDLLADLAAKSIR